MLSSPGLAVSDTAEEPSPAPAGLLSGRQKSLHAPPQREAGQTEQDGPPVHDGCDSVHCRLLEDDVGDLGGGVFLLGIAHLVLTGVKADAGGAEGG